MIIAAGGEPVACRPRQRSAATSWSEIAASAPDVMIIAPCGFDLEGAVGQAERILDDPAVIDLFVDTGVWAIDADGIMVRPGPRLVDGVEALAAILHPEVATPRARQAVRRVR
jgi:iron complex transport system substrate-binding protein